MVDCDLLDQVALEVRHRLPAESYASTGGSDV
jgi:hypothetical protein